MRYKDKVVVVTGGSKGIGFGCVRVFVEDGGSEVVFCARNAEEGQSVEAHLNAHGP
ncbi:MAG TPA: SDR family NAD(P)-dependent oxidoreductase, partial [Polyangia bacterium]